jgi:hypothetical protein
MVKAKKKGGPKGKVQEEDDGDWEALLEAEGVAAPKADEKAPVGTEAADLSPSAETDVKPTASTTAAPLDAAAAFLAAQGIAVGGGGDDAEDKKDSKKKKKKKPAGEKKPEEKPEKVR